jgi:Dolichyl-phosphate-mannose-protein mannosyltransferase
MPDTTKKKHLWQSPLAIFFVALALRLLGVRLFYNSTWNDYQDHLLFGYETGRIARSITEGHGFGNPISLPSGPTAWLTPVYPYLLAGVFRLCGVYTKTSALVILSLNSLFSALICFPLFHMAKRSFGRSVAIAACWIWTVFPYFIYIPGGFVWDTCLGALLVATLFLWALKLGEQHGSLWSWLGFGVFGGFTVLTNASALTVCCVLAAWAVFPLWQTSRTPQRPPTSVISRDHRRWLLPAFLVAAGLVVTLLPWQVRNYRAFHALVPLRDNFWLEFWDGNDGDTTSWVDIERHPTINPDEGALFAKLGEIPYMQEKRRKALDFLALHPGLYLVQCVRRFLYVWTGFWNLDPSNRLDEFHGFANVYLTSSLSLAMLVGLWRALRNSAPLPEEAYPRSGPGLCSVAASSSHSRNVVPPVFRTSRAAALPYLLVLSFYPLIFYITHPTIRHRHAIDPEVVVLAALGVRSLFPASRSSKSPAVPPTVTPS